MWSGPRNISTALMRSFENRKDTSVIDEPFYAYYLQKTKLKHPMYKEIIAKYESDYNRIIHHTYAHLMVSASLDWKGRIFNKLIKFA